jgi:hypothetical protein
MPKCDDIKMRCEPWERWVREHLPAFAASILVSDRYYSRTLRDEHQLHSGPSDVQVQVTYPGQDRPH